MSSEEKAVLVFSDKFHQHSYLKVKRLRLPMDLIEEYGMFDTSSPPCVEARKAGEPDVIAHSLS